MLQVGQRPEQIERFAFLHHEASVSISTRALDLQPPGLQVVESL
jgi:hypothetical protein